LLDTETREKLKAEISKNIIPALTVEAEKISIEESSIIAIDWMNGRRTPDANQLLKGTISGLTLGSTAPRIYKALVEATAFGSRAIVERMREEGVRIDNVIGIGGIALKSPFVMQTLSDVLNMPIKVCRTEQACALGAAMFAATAAGLYPKVEDAQKAMNSGFDREYQPNMANVDKYSEIYEKYLELGKFTEEHLFNEE
jgi:L-ribulokinase